MDVARRALQQARDLHASGSKDVAYFKWLTGFFAILGVLEERVLFAENTDGDNRLQASKAIKLFSLAAKTLERAEECLSAVVECSKAEAEVLESTSPILQDSIEAMPMQRRRSLRNPSLAASAEKETDGGGVPRIPVSTLQFCWFELTYHLQFIAQSFYELHELGAKDKANAVFVRTARKLLSDAEWMSKQRDDIERIQGEAEQKPFAAFNADDIRDMAKHLTLIDFSIFRRIQAGDWSDKEHAEGALAASQDLFNYTLRWAQGEILDPAFPVDRAVVVGKLVQLAEELKRRHSFNMLVAIVSGIGAVTLERLRTTWTVVRTQHKSTMVSLDNLRAFIGERKNFSAMRAVLAKNPKPCIPFLGILRRDLAAMSVARTSSVEPSRETRANWEASLAHLHACQQHAYAEGPCDSQAELMMQHWLLSRRWCDQHAIDALVQEREPSNATAPPYIEHRPEATPPKQAIVVLDESAIEAEEPLNDPDEGVPFEMIHERLRSDFARKERRMSGFEQPAAVHPASPVDKKAYAHFYTEKSG